jgi:Xaa-Pro aminopeptidase
VLMIDGGPSYKGYYSDIIRSAIIGKPTQKQLDTHSVLVEACYLGLSKLKPGEPLENLVKAVDEFLDKKGMTPINRTLHWIGHGLGLDFHEYPCLELGTKEAARPGMCFACEPCVCDENGMFGIEENVVVTDTGYELMTPFRHDLISIS